MDDVNRLIARAKNSSSKVTVGFNMRWHRLVSRAKTLLEQGVIGPIHSLHAVYTDEARDRPGLPAWRVHRQQGGGALLEKAVHHFDLWHLSASERNNRSLRQQSIYKVGRRHGHCNRPHRDLLGSNGYGMYREQWTVEVHLERYFALIEQIAAAKA